MSYDKILKRFNKINLDHEKKLSNEEISQFLDGHYFDEFLFNTINETFKVSLWYLDLLTFKIHIGKKAYKILDIKPGEFNNDLTRALKAIVHPDFSDYINNHFTPEFLKLDSKLLTFKVKKSDDSDAWIGIKGHYLNNDTSSRAAVGIISDITEIVNQRESITNYENFLSTIIEMIPTPIYFKDLDNKYQKFNKAFSNLLGLNSNEILGKTTQEVHAKDNAKFYCDKDNELIKSGEQQIYDRNINTPCEGNRLVRFCRDLIYNSNNEPTGIVGSLLDITATKEKELKLERMNLLLNSLIEVSQAVLEINTMKDLFQVVIEKALAAIPVSNFGSVLIRDEENYLTILAQKGYDKKESKDFKIKFEHSFSYTYAGGNLKSPIIINSIQSVSDKFPELVSPEYGVCMKSTLCTPIIVNGEVYALVNVDSVNNNVFDDYDIELMTILKNQIELVIQNMNLYKQVLEISQTDPLTSLYNRGYFENYIQSVIKRAQRYHETFFLLIVDINDLKVVNDLFGHNIGDRYINNFAKIFASHIRGSDIVARYGGDEFIAVFFSDDFEEITKKMESINRRFMNEVLIKNHDFTQSFSYGIAQYPNDATKFSGLVKVADEKMYNYKRRIKSGIHNTLNN